MLRGNNPELRWQVNDSSGNTEAIVLPGSILNTTDWFFIGIVIDSPDLPVP
jgi:hypothetical protein